MFASAESGNNNFDDVIQILPPLGVAVAAAGAKRGEITTTPRPRRDILGEISCLAAMKVQLPIS